jgi:hypothetical protein
MVAPIGCLKAKINPKAAATVVMVMTVVMMVSVMTVVVRGTVIVG